MLRFVLLKNDIIFRRLEIIRLYFHLVKCSETWSPTWRYQGKCQKHKFFVPSPDLRCCSVVLIFPEFLSPPLSPSVFKPHLSLPKGPGMALGPNRVPGIESWFAECKASALLAIHNCCTLTDPCQYALKNLQEIVM